MDEEQENQASAFEKQSQGKAKSKLNDLQRKKKNVNKIITIIKTKKVIIPLLIILCIVISLVMWGGFVSIFYDLSIGSTNSAKRAAISTSYSTDSTSPETGNTEPSKNTSVNSSRVVVKPTKNKDAYEITNNYTSDEIKKIREELEKDTSRDISDFSDFEIAIIGALAENGLDIDDWNISELKCFPAFIKAEACTQHLDLRSNSDKFKGGKYVPEKVELDDSKVPGVILVQRTNTNGNEVTPLEYMKEAEFNNLVESNNEDAIRYFTLNSKGNLIIATWKSTEITVKGEYPENLSESEKEKSTLQYDIDTIEYPYKQYIKDFTMPFELLVQLLATAEDPSFCLELAEYVMGSKIVINIQEEETYTHTVEERIYTIHSKDEKRIDYNIASVVEIESNTNYLLLGDKVDDKGQPCTNYYDPINKAVTIDRKYKEHSYHWEIIEADTWYSHIIKNYAAPSEEKDPESKNTIKDEPDDYTEISGNGPITDTNETIKDKDAKKFKEDIEKYYKELIIIPEVNLKAGTREIWDPLSEQYIEIQNDDEINITPKNKIESTSLPSGVTTYKCNHSELPSQINITTKEDGVPSIRFTYNLNNGKYQTTYTKDQIAQCNVTKLDIKNFERIDLVNNITSNKTKYKTDPNPINQEDVYDKTNEKFLQVYDKSERAQHMIRSVASWLFEAMEEDENTVEISDKIKYLLYKYDGTDYGVTEAPHTELFELSEFNTYTTNNSFDAIKNFIHHFEGTPKYNTDKSKYIVFDDGAGNATVGWGIDIKMDGYSNVFKSAGYGTEFGAEVDIDFVDALETEELNECIKYVKSNTENLTDYQIGALVSRCYQMGKSGALFTNKHKYEMKVIDNFADSYKKYWNANDTENYYKKAITDEIYNHNLYKNYMQVSTYASGKQLGELVRRRQWEWQLFTTGYDATTKTYWSSSGGSIDNINLYNADGTVNKTAISNLNADLTRRVNNRSDKEMNSPYNSLSYKQCTWWAYTRASQYLEQYGTKYTKYPSMSKGYTQTGHGGEWYDNNKKNGWFNYGQEPRPNSIVSWKDGSYGHVAYVEAVDYINKKIYISHAGGGKSWYGIIDIPITGQLWSGRTLNGYIYLDSPK